MVLIATTSLSNCILRKTLQPATLSQEIYTGDPMVFIMDCKSYGDHIIASMENQELDNGTPIDSALQLLQHTAEIVDLFNLKCPLRNIRDIRLITWNSFYSFMLDWREKSTDDNSSFNSSKLWFDLQSICLGFHALVQVKLQSFPHSCIRLAIVNQDCVENHFCQVRSYNGQNNNLTYNQQQSTQNLIQFGQTVISRKSNVGVPSITDSACC